MDFKTKWNQVDELCPHCNNVVKPAKGLNRQNLKRLFSFKIKPSEYLTIVIVVLVILGAFSYQSDIRQCRYVLNNLGDVCRAQIHNTINSTTTSSSNIFGLNNTLKYEP